MNLRSSNGVQDLERDPLTGLYTRASANRIVKNGIEEAQGDEGVISVALLDIDRFEHFDEEHGLSAGDALLKSVSEIILAAETGADAISRYSRDTFLLVFPGRGPEDALLAAEKVRSFFDTNPLILGHQDEPLEVKVSLSSGVASYPNQAHDDRDLLRKAQGALVRAKETGRGAPICGSAPRRPAWPSRPAITPRPSSTSSRSWPTNCPEARRRSSGRPWTTCSGSSTACASGPPKNRGAKSRLFQT